MSRKALPIVALAIGLGVPFVLSPYLTFQAATALSYLPALLGLVVITGLGGQLSLGHGAFFAIGAYTTGILVKLAGWNYLATLPVATVLSFAAGALIGIPSLRIRGHFLAVLTLAVAVALPQIIKALDSVTNGVHGLAIIIDDPAPWTGLDATRRNYLVALLAAALAFAATRGLRSSHVGRALRALRDDERVAASLGIPVAWLKIAAFGFSAALAGLGGGVFAIVVGFVAPENFGIGLAALFIIGLILGGKNSEWGAVAGSLLIVAVPIYAGKVDETASGLVFAVLVLGAVYVLPGGIQGLVARLGARRSRSASRHEAPRRVVRPAPSSPALRSSLQQSID
jgi:branched-chain amino acid transport system permease protein